MNISEQLVKLYTPHSLSNQDEVFQTQSDIFGSFEKDGSRQEAFQILKKFFFQKSISSERVLLFRETYWEWFVRIGWDIFDTLSPDDVYILVGYTTPYAFVLGYDVTYIYVSYFATRPGDFPELSAVHKKIAQHLVASDIPLIFGLQNKDNELSYHSLMMSIERWGQVDALAKADIYQKIQSVLFSEAHDDAFLKHVPTRIQDFVQFLRLFTDVKDIEKIAKSYFQDVVEMDQKNSPLIDDRNMFFRNINTGLELIGEDKLEYDAVMFLYNISQFMHVVLGLDSTVVHTPDEILSKLQVLASDKKNPKIMDVYYFNEQTNQFEWDESLLKELKLIPPDFDMSTIAK